MKAFGEAVGLLIAVAAMIWFGLIYYANPDQKPIIACKPVLVAGTGLQTTAAAANSTQQNSQAPNSAHTARVSDANTGRELAFADRIALGCLRFTDRLFNK